MSDKKKWDDKKEGKKPWEHGYVPPPKPTEGKKKKRRRKKVGPGSIAEDIHDEMVSRNKKIVKHVGGWSKSNK